MSEPLLDMPASGKSRFRHSTKGEDQPATNIPRKPIQSDARDKVDSSGIKSGHHTSNLSKPIAHFSPSEVIVERDRSHTGQTGTTNALKTCPTRPAESSIPANSQRSKSLRRKPSTIDRYAAQKLPGSNASFSDYWTPTSGRDHPGDDLQNTVLGISLPLTSDETPADIQRHWTPSNLPPSVANYALTATPSTRYTGSPFSHAPTPSSVSSYGSELTGYTVDEKYLHPYKESDQSPARSRPKISVQTSDKSAHATSRLRLPPVRESSTSSSNSTVKQSKTRSGKTTDEAQSTNPIPRTMGKSFATSTSSSRSKIPPSGTLAANKAKTTQAPPELAHLNVELNSRAVYDKKAQAPRRPSRDGIAPLTDVTKPSPVVQSDLPNMYNTYHKRNSSQDRPRSPSKPRSGNPSREASHRQSRCVDLAQSSERMADISDSRAPKTTKSPSGRKVLRKDSPALAQASPGKSPGKSTRFGFFSRKPKATEVALAEDKTRRRHSKGPAAGTGHEGYGRFAGRGRSGSMASSTGNRSPSVTSAASSTKAAQSTRRGSTATRRSSGANSQDSSDMDEFLRERLRPVYLRGSGSTGSNYSNTAVPASDVPGSAHTASSTSTSLDSYPTPQLLPSAMQQRRSISPAKIAPASRKFRSNSSDTGSQTSLQSRNERKLAFSSTQRPAEDATNQVSRRWNFFQRVHASPTSKSKNKTQPRPVDTKPVEKINGVAHYALLESVQTVGLSDVERMLHDAETSADESVVEFQRPSNRHIFESSHTQEMTLFAAEHKHDDKLAVAHDSPMAQSCVYSNESLQSSSVAASEPRAASAALYLEKAPPRPQTVSGNVDTPENSFQGGLAGERVLPGVSPRQPRLSPVGRIPRVVSKRDRDRKLPDKSFSRPFAQAQPRPIVKPPGTLYTQIRKHASPEPDSQPFTSANLSSVETQNSTTSGIGSSAEESAFSYSGFNQQQYTTTNSRKDSDVSYSSSNHSWLAGPAVLSPEQEDPWNEYNDLIDDMLPLRTPASSSSSCGAPFQYMISSTNSPALSNHSDNCESRPFEPPTGQTSRLETTPSIPQQIDRLMRPSLTSLNTSHTISDFVDQYGLRDSHTLSSPNGSSIPQPLGSGQRKSHRNSLPSTRCSDTSLRDSCTSVQSRPTSMLDTTDRNAKLTTLQDSVSYVGTSLPAVLESEVELDRGTADSRIRADALLTSQWLMGGRVLFSPAHDTIKGNTDPQILVIDGLGSDWSHHVAAQYPNATVYNLDVRSSHSTHVGSSVPSQKARSNQRNISHGCLESAFPWPKGFFTAVVFRFPVATTNEAYHAAICECKRVLKPGGYLEIAVLDLDLKHMGPLARQTVRNLKLRMQSRNSKVGLGNLSDVLVRMTGRRGFEEVQCCLLGLPVAAKTFSKETQQLSSLKLPQTSPLDAPTPVYDNDSDMPSVAAQVGRWWYSSCYESPLRRQDSIWKNRALLRECRAESTSFRMLVWCAQRPTQPCRRTVSF